MMAYHTFYKNIYMIFCMLNPYHNIQRVFSAIKTA